MTQIKGNTALAETEDKKPVLSITAGGKGLEKTNQVKESIPEKKEPTLQELKNRATLIHLLDEKHTKLTAKRSSLDRFIIKHESENAQIVVTDANGEEFKSSSPRTIGKVLEFWKQEFDEAITEIENEIKIQFAA